MNPVEAIPIALRGISAHKLRSFLTMLGLVIGVGAVISLMSIGTGAEAMITERIQSVGGPNVLQVSPGRAMQGMAQAAMGSASTLTLEDAEAIADPRNCPSVSLVAPTVMTFAQVVAGEENLSTRILGVSSEYEDVFNWGVTQGEFIAQHHVDAQSRVCLLGTTVAEELFGGVTPIGQRVRIKNIPFRVIGLLESKGAFMMLDTDDTMMIPITTAKAKLSTQRTARGERTVNSISVQVADESLLDVAIQEITALLRERHRITERDDFTVLSQSEIVEMVGEVMGILTILLGSIAGISLLVGGIGIMNIMLVSVTERTREIGIRKAVGAKRRDILIQFIIEAATLSIMGGAIGIFIGWSVAQIFSGLNLGFGALVSIDAVILAFSVSAAIGLFFGIYPATRAAWLNPIDALRYE